MAEYSLNIVKDVQYLQNIDQTAEYTVNIVDMAGVIALA
jgi:hypothetical protein